uniref:N-alpha-acetyltransferase 40 n=1 Tax=Schistocephalus solidus TaxID=70667 RepID=A0A0X3NZL9_SCHSO
MFEPQFQREDQLVGDPASHLAHSQEAEFHSSRGQHDDYPIQSENEQNHRLRWDMGTPAMVCDDQRYMCLFFRSKKHTRKRDSGAKSSLRFFSASQPQDDLQ